MNILIKSVKIIDPRSKYNNQKKDILIKNGKIQKISNNINTGAKKIIEEKNLYVSPGWFDLHVNFGEPGFEQRDTIETGVLSAIKGGFTGVQIMPNTIPSLDNRGQIDFICNKVKDSIIDILPSGNITKNQEGNSIVEMHDMHEAGCRSFTDDKKSLIRSEILMIAMLYSKDVNALIMNFPNEKDISKDGQVNEGKTSTKLGIKGIPNIAEEIMVDRDISIAKYTNSRLHLSYISTRESVQKIKKAKKSGIKITSDVALHNLFLTDISINNFDTRYKVLPPLREKSDVNALIKGIQNSTIDVITSDHTPINTEEKKIEFENASFGIIGLESAFGLIGKYLRGHIELEKIIQLISINPRKILNLEDVIIEEHTEANLTFFNPDLEWIFTKNDIASKSENSPFIEESLKGKAFAIYNQGKFKKC